MYKVSDIKISKSISVRDALSVIDNGAMRIALVVDENDRLIGTISDGDIRRALLSGLNLDDNISSVYNPNPVVCKTTDSKDKIIQTAVSKKLFQVPIINELGQVVKLAEIDKLVKTEEYPNRVLLMAGGLGKRLLPLTKDQPKPMLEVGGKPILETVIERFSKYGFRNIIISLNYLGEKIIDYFGNGDQFDVSIEYIEEKKKLGTAGALSLLKCEMNEPFFVMNGDVLTKLNFKNLLDFHISNNAYATMGVREYDMEVPYGVVKTNQNDIISIKEKPVQKFFVNAGVYMLDPKIINHIPKDVYTDMTELFELVVAMKKKTVSFPVREFWMDIGKEEDLKKACKDYLKLFND